ncbi:hypothetical protein UlMin_025188 [Ulmus minor]
MGSKMREWSHEEIKALENAFVNYPEGLPDRWERIAGEISTRSTAEVYQYCFDLDNDVKHIVLGLVPLPIYTDDHDNNFITNFQTTVSPMKIKKNSKSQNKKVKHWTKEEHELFLLGLKLYGRGRMKWKKIASLIGTRDSTQVASHAQKYFNKLDKTAN